MPDYCMRGAEQLRLAVPARWRTWLLLLSVAIALPLGAWFAGAAWRVARLDPDGASDAASLFDTRGRLIATVGNRRQAYVPFEDIPVSLRNAVIATEDERFYRHFGIDPRGIARSIWVDIKRGGTFQGASTITQQLARNLFLSFEKTFTRKLKEAGYALLLEMRFTKPRILEMYLNTVYFGEGVYGIEAASFTYFGKSTAQLTLAESALLVGVLKAPSALSPYNDEKAALERRNVVINHMAELHYITPAQAKAAEREPVRLAKRRGGQAPYFVDYVTAELVKRFGATAVYKNGLRVITTLDLDMQAAARDALGDVQGAIVALDPRSGGIRAMVGGRDYAESQFNRATQALRQPGSAFKPFVYAAALEKGWTMNQTLIDHPGNFNGYQPQNFKGEYWGQVTLKQALTRSLNTASVRLLQQIGVSSAIDMATRLGINTLLPDDRNLALALGGLTKGVTPLEMAAAYAPFANEGWKYPPFAIEQVMDRNGQLLYRNHSKPRRVISPEVAYLMTNMLQSVVERGTGSAANIGRPQAGKTGTTNDAVSAWFVGYTPQIVAAVYVGHDVRKPLAGGGGSIAAPIWGKFAVKALRDLPAVGFAVPPSVQTNIPVDVFTGQLAGPSCRLQELDAFVVGTAPINAAPCYWNAAAQPQPYQLGALPQGQPGAPFAQLPGGIVGDDPDVGLPGISMPAAMLFPLGPPTQTQSGIAGILNAAPPKALDSPAILPNPPASADAPPVESQLPADRAGAPPETTRGSGFIQNEPPNPATPSAGSTSTQQLQQAPVASSSVQPQAAEPVTTAPAADTPKPAADTPKPAADTPKPAADTPKPAASAPKPAADTPKPAASAPKPAANTPKPAANAPKPAQNKLPATTASPVQTGSSSHNSASSAQTSTTKPITMQNAEPAPSTANQATVSTEPATPAETPVNATADTQQPQPANIDNPSNPSSLLAGPPGGRPMP